MAGDPVRDLLGQRRLGVGVVRGAEDGDEQLDRDPLAGGRVDDARLLAGVVDEELLAGVVDLAHRQAAPAEPAAVDLAELGVAVPVGVLLEVLEVEQLQGDAGLAALGVQGGAVRPRPAAAPGHRAAARTAAPPGRRRSGPRPGPSPARRPGRAATVVPTAPLTDAEALGDRPVAAAQGPLLAQNLAGVSHGQSLGGHSSPFGWMAPSDRPAPLRSGHPPPGGCTGGVITMTDPGGHDADPGDHDRPIRVITMLRSTCSRWAETRTSPETRGYPRWCGRRLDGFPRLPRGAP